MRKCGTMRVINPVAGCEFWINSTDNPRHLPSVIPSADVNRIQVSCNGEALCLVGCYPENRHYVYQGCCNFGDDRRHIAGGFLMIDGVLELATFNGGDQNIDADGMRDVYRQR